jgi:hypothetical protein
VQRDLLQPLVLDRGRAGQQLVEHHAERVDVAARVDVDLIHLRLLGRHVLERPDDQPQAREPRVLRQLRLGRLGQPEVDHLRHGLAVIAGDEHVGRLEVAVDDPLLVRVLHGLADQDEQLQPFPGREAMPVAVLGDGHALDQLHHEVRAAGRRAAGIEDLGDVRVVHHRQRLPLRFEPRDDRTRVQAQLDDLDRHLARHGLRLLGAEDGTHAAFADLLEEAIGADAAARAFGEQAAALARDLARAGRRLEQEAARPIVGPQQVVEAAAQARVAAARGIQEGGTLGRRPQQGEVEQVLFVHCGLARRTGRRGTPWPEDEPRRISRLPPAGRARGRGL